MLRKKRTDNRQKILLNDAFLCQNIIGRGSVCVGMINFSFHNKFWKAVFLPFTYSRRLASKLALEEISTKFLHQHRVDDCFLSDADSSLPANDNDK